MAKPIAKLVALITPKRTWLQFRLQNLFVLVFVVSLVYGWHAFQIAKFRREWAQVQAIQDLGGSVNATFRDGRVWFVREVFLAHSRVTDNDLAVLEPHTSVTKVDLTGTAVTDGGLHHLKVLDKLARLSLVGTNVTDAGVAELQTALPNCEIIR